MRRASLPTAIDRLPELTVAAVVERRGRYLLVEERIDGHLVLNQPAGHVEVGETLQVAVVREVLEEAGCTFTPEATIGAYLWARRDGRAPYLRVAFTGTCSGELDQHQLDEGIERVLWLSRSDLVARSTQLRSPMVLRAVDDYERGLRFPVDLFQGLPLDKLALGAAIL
jgi:8-oxo-dGTP pyrophosphatase MutT (NUDIX family)